MKSIFKLALGTRDSLSQLCSTLYPVMYGPGSWALQFITALYFVQLLITTFYMVNFITSSKKFHFSNRFLFQVFLTLFLFLRVMSYVVPWPFPQFWETLMYDQLPRYVLFLSWEFLSVWLGQAVFPPVKSKCTKFISTASFLLLLFILFCISVGASIWMSQPSTGVKTQYGTSNWPTTISNLILYFVIFLSACVCGLRLTYIFCTTISFGPYKIRMRALYVLVIITILIFFLRFMHSLLRVVSNTFLNKLFEKLNQNCANDFKDDCEGLYIGIMLIYVVWEIIPITTFIIVYGILTVNTPSPSSRPSHPKSQRSHSRTPSSSYASSSPSETADTAESTPSTPQSTYSTGTFSSDAHTPLTPTRTDYSTDSGFASPTSSTTPSSPLGEEEEQEEYNWYRNFTLKDPALQSYAAFNDAMALGGYPPHSQYTAAQMGVDVPRYSTNSAFYTDTSSLTQGYTPSRKLSTVSLLTIAPDGTEYVYFRDASGKKKKKKKKRRRVVPEESLPADNNAGGGDTAQ